MVLLASDYDRSKYLRAEDLKRDTKFRIKAITEEVFERDGRPEKKLVLWFTTDERGLVLNKTNIRTLRGPYGDDTASWVGRVIVVFPVIADFRGKMTPALRVRIPPPKQAAPQQPSPAGNGAAAAPLAGAAAAVPLAATLAAVDLELDPDPMKSLREEMDDEIPW
jgi:hypothetical protein